MRKILLACICILSTTACTTMTGKHTTRMTEEISEDAENEHYGGMATATAGLIVGTPIMLIADVLTLGGTLDGDDLAAVSAGLNDFNRTAFQNSQQQLNSVMNMPIPQATPITGFGSNQIGSNRISCINTGTVTNCRY
jgi:hypothetical protein